MEGFSYSVRESSRAKHVSLTVSPRRGLVVVVPVGFDRGRIPELLEGRRAWVERTSARLEERRQHVRCDDRHLPATVDLAACGETWMVSYTPSPSPRVTARERAGSRLTVSGDGAEFEACRAALLRWMRRRARAVLAARVSELARMHGLSCPPISIRAQRTRWGSCSRRGTISLNQNLLFLPPHLADYVLVHELCHTQRMDHSRAFWTLVEGCDPDFRQNRRDLKDAWRFVPAWVDGGSGE